MFHAIGKGSNGGYFQDSTFTDKIKHKIDFEKFDKSRLLRLNSCLDFTPIPML